MNNKTIDLSPLLKKHFGYSSFRPLQEDIIRATLNNEDVVALLPTGGGKSLCFQLPALIRKGLTVVVSPLISLMKDQVDGLTAGGISATFLNSSLKNDESRKRLRGIYNHEYRLLYVAPERLMLPGFLDDLQKWAVDSFAIDEAHCISEWGHDFRPEYRKLAELREKYPSIPIMALTATATERVREDIIKSLNLRAVRRFTASFNRPNLSYHIVGKSDPYDQVLEFVRRHPSESGIVYCQSRKSTESLAERLTEDGIKALPYHAGMENTDRSHNQEMFQFDKVNVICATIAFGMGIHKSNVRYVVHYDLPKNIEGYYQETGRAGRDGLASECLLLFSRGDAVKIRMFIEKVSDPTERKVASDHLNHIIRFAEDTGCRRVALLKYFGEKYPSSNCGNCDNCLATRPQYDGTLEAQKLMSCIGRIQQKSGFSVGLNHVVEVLTGADTEKIQRWDHKQLSTYGIGKDRTKTEWMNIGYELMRLGYVNQNTEQYNTLELTPEGLKILKERKPIILTKSLSAPPIPSKSGSKASRKAMGEITCDEVLFESLRALRRELADDLGVPAYAVFSDAVLRQMARSYPTDEAKLLRISGVGEQKLRKFGEDFIEIIKLHVAQHARQSFKDEDEAPAKARPRSANDTERETLRLFKSGMDVAAIAQKRNLTPATIFNHLFRALQQGEALDIRRFVTPAQLKEIETAFAQQPDGQFKPIYEKLNGAYSYEILRMVRVLKSIKP
jgi:ATP-dependent DNA helicase RecQ